MHEFASSVTAPAAADAASAALSAQPQTRHRRTFDSYHLLALGLVVFSFFMSALVSRAVFDRMPHLEDEVAYLFQARVFARGQLVVPTPQPSRAFWQPFVVDDPTTGSRAGKYSPGWPLLLAPGVLLGATWVVNAFFGALTVALTYRLGRDLFNRDTGLLAALLVAFSPMALLLNGSLMGHTAALCCGTLFLWAYRRLEVAVPARRGNPLRRLRHGLGWGALAGLALGLMAINRPLSALGVALPLVAWSAARLLRGVWADLRARQKTTHEAAEPPLGIMAWLRQSAVVPALAPLLLLAAGTLLVALAIPLFNTAATGRSNANLYEYVWPYDKVGFGQGYGRNGHTLEKTFRHARFDLSLTAADLFGWQIGEMTPALLQQLRTRDGYYPNTGISWLLLAPGLLVGVWGMRAFAGRGIRLPRVLPWRVLGLAVWLGLGIWLLLHSINLPQAQLQDARFAWTWIFLAFGWTLLPLLPLAFERQPDHKAIWTWLLASVVLCLLIAQGTYWIGSQRYSTRYYYEALGAAGLLSALPLAWLVTRLPRLRLPLYALLLALSVFCLYSYSTPRISTLHRFNYIGPDLVNAVEARRIDGQRILVLVTGSDVRWRAHGALMTVTSPFLDSPIVVAHDNLTPGRRDAILANFPGWQVVEMYAEGNVICFSTVIDPAAPDCYGEVAGVAPSG